MRPLGEPLGIGRLLLGPEQQAEEVLCLARRLAYPKATAEVADSLSEVQEVLPLGFPESGLVSAAVLGAVLLIVTFALNLPQKAADADELNDNLKPIYTQELIDGAQGSLAVVAAMGEEMQGTMLPDLAAQLGMNPDELNAFLGENFPATAQALQTMPDSLERFEGFVGIFAVNLDNYETIKPVSFTPIIWMMVIGGILILLAGGYCIIVK